MYNHRLTGVDDWWLALRQEGNVYSNDSARSAHPVRGDMWWCSHGYMELLTEFVRSPHQLL